MPGLEYKRVPFELKEMIDLAGGGWEIAGYASTFGGQPDAQGDIVAPGAFAASIATRPTKLLYEHQTPIGKQLELREDEHGLYGRWTIVDTVAGTDAYKLAKGGVLDSLSIGYIPTQVAYRPEDDVRVLLAVDLFEVSAVAIPANTNAVITDVKADQASALDAHADDVAAMLAGWMTRCRAGLSAKEGRAISSARRERMAAVSSSLKDATTEIDAMLAETAPEKAIDFDRERRRRRLARLGIVKEA